MNKIHLYKIVILFLLASMLLIFNNCVPEVPGQKTSTRTSRAPSSAPLPPAAPKSEEEVLNAIQVSTGMKNFEQILHTMSAVTGVDSQNSSIRNVYGQLESSLPTGNDVKVFMASHQVAITKLAAEYCQVLVESSTLRPAIWPNFNFGLRPNQNAFNETNRLYIINQAINSFWIVASDAEIQAAEQELMPLFDEMLMNENLTSTAVTRNVVKGICTTVLSSVQVTLL